MRTRFILGVVSFNQHLGSRLVNCISVTCTPQHSSSEPCATAGLVEQLKHNLRAVEPDVAIV